MDSQDGQDLSALGRAFVPFVVIFPNFCWSVEEKRQATCHKEKMADSLPVRHRTQTGNVRPPLTLVPPNPDQATKGSVV